LAGLALGAGLLLLQYAEAAPHTFYDDGGMVRWKLKFAEAVAQAKQSNRPLFIHVCKDSDKPSEDQVVVLFRDEKLARLINRHMHPVVLDASKLSADLGRYPDIKKIVDKFIAGRGLVPGILMLPIRAQINPQQYTGEGWLPMQLSDQMLDVLEDQYKMGPTTVTMLTKQVEALEKALADKKSWTKATKLYNDILSAPGYNKVRDAAFDAMEKATAEPAQELVEAYNHAKQDEYENALKLTTKVQAEFKGLPIAEEAKAHAGALKLLEAATKAAADPKMKAAALKSFDSLLNTYAETPYAGLAVARKKDLAPVKK